MIYMLGLLRTTSNYTFSILNFKDNVNNIKCNFQCKILSVGVCQLVVSYRDKNIILDLMESCGFFGQNVTALSIGKFRTVKVKVLPV